MPKAARIAAVIVVVIGLVTFLFGRSMVVIATDALWFDAIGYGSVFQTTLLAQIGLGLASALGAFALLQANAVVALSRSPGGAAMNPELVDNPIGQLLMRVPAATLTGVVSAILAVFIGLFMSTQWSLLLLYLNGGSFGWTEPVLNHDASFYVFTLPLLQSLRGTLFAVVVLGAISAAVLYGLRGAIRLDIVERGGQAEVRGVHISTFVKSHLGVLVGAGLVLVGAGSWLARYDLMYHQAGLISGPGSADIIATMPLLTLQAACAVIAAPIAFAAIARGVRPAWAGVGALVFLPGLLSAFVPGMVQRYRVEPNEIALESEHITSHIAATRHAFALDGVEERDLSGTAELSWADIQANQPTLDNVRLWDHKPLLDTFSQVQEIRTYYDFAHVDNDRYMINGELRQIMLSPRELVASSLPSRARTWVNETMTYTHGYGIALGPVNEVTEEGLPRLWVQDLPPQVAYPDDLRIDEPALYFGEVMTEPVFVRTDNREFDYPTGDGEAYTTYEGDGGVQIGGGIWRAAWALRLNSSNVILSGEINADSRILLHRGIRERVSTIAPFLGIDNDPYLVIDDGRLVWVLDGYTGTRRFPYAEAWRFPDWRTVNYMRSSVKITVDAYTGETLFYAVDDNDPILAAWRATFPDLFLPGTALSDGLRAHLRYPQDAFEAQAKLFATYHMTDPQVFYNREDEWEVPAVDGQMMEPYYTVMKLPGEETEEFIVMLPFVPKTKENLAAWMVARSDGSAYGGLRAYQFPKDRVLYGPSQVASRFKQDATISPQLTLWSSNGSQTNLGTMLVIPVEESLIYVQPLYLQASQSTGAGQTEARSAIPELKRVLVGYENRVAMEPTLDAALRKLFAVEVEDQAREDRATDTTTTEGASGGGDLAVLAMRQYRDAEVAMQAGNWAAYGVALDALELTLLDLTRMEDPQEGVTEPEPIPEVAPE